MRIGVDLDNTLICYNRVFLSAAQQSGLVPSGWEGSKRKLREYLREKEGGEIAWQSLQREVYGRQLHHAQLFPGAERFLWRCKQLGLEVEVVSHKTEYGHFDTEKISLRVEAMKWMEARQFFDACYFGIKKKDVFFADTREEKVNIIARLNCDWFIDDLPEVFDEKHAEKLQKKLYEYL